MVNNGVTVLISKKYLKYDQRRNIPNQLRTEYNEYKMDNKERLRDRKKEMLI